MAFVLLLIFKANRGQPSSIEKDFEGEAKVHDPLIVEVENSHPKGDTDDVIERYIRVTIVETPDTINGINGWETLRRVMIYGKSSQVILDWPAYDMTRHLHPLYTTE